MTESAVVHLLLVVLSARMLLNWLVRKGIAKPDEAWCVFLQVVVSLAAAVVGILSGWIVLVLVPGCGTAIGWMLYRAHMAWKHRRFGRSE